MVVADEPDLNLIKHLLRFLLLLEANRCSAVLKAKWHYQSFDIAAEVGCLEADGQSRADFPTTHQIAGQECIVVIMPKLRVSINKL